VKRITPWLWMALLAVILTGCGGKADRWQEVSEGGVLRVGLDASYPPFEQADGAGEITGFDVDLANEIGRRLGVEVAFTNIAYDGLYDSLATDQVDVLISALAAGGDAEGRADFSDPYFNAGQHLVTPVGSAITTMDDMEGRRLAVEVGSGGDVEARRWERRLASIDITRTESPDAAVRAVLAGAADAALVDGITARLAVGGSDGLVLGEAVTDELYAIAVDEESPRLRAQINEALAAMMADGTVDALIETWFGPQG
jgi:polar amino acid transport system substrate-binding protein